MKSGFYHAVEEYILNSQYAQELCTRIMENSDKLKGKLSRTNLESLREWVSKERVDKLIKLVEPMN